MYLYRAVDSDGQTLEFLLSSTRDAEAAKRFFLKALQLSTCSASRASGGEKPAAESFGAGTLKASKPAPRVINVDKNAAYPKAIAELKATGLLPQQVELRQVRISQQPDRTRPSVHESMILLDQIIQIRALAVIHTSERCVLRLSVQQRLWGRQRFYRH